MLSDGDEVISYSVNTPELLSCPNCNGKGYLGLSREEGVPGEPQTVFDSRETCDICWGTGFVTYLGHKKYMRSDNDNEN